MARSNFKEDMTTVEVLVKTVTGKAVIFVKDDEEHWVPRSTLGWRTDIELEKNVGETINARIATWKAKDLGWG